MSDFDRNFQVKVQGTWCEYQEGLSVDLSKIKRVVSYREEMGWPFKFYFTDGDYVYVQRAEIGRQIEQALKNLSGRHSEIEKLKVEKAGLLKLAGQWREQTKEMCRVDDKHVISSLLSCAEQLEVVVRGEHE